MNYIILLTAAVLFLFAGWDMVVVIEQSDCVLRRWRFRFCCGSNWNGSGGGGAWKLMEEEGEEEEEEEVEEEVEEEEEEEEEETTNLKFFKKISFLSFWTFLCGVPRFFRRLSHAVTR